MLTNKLIEKNIHLFKCSNCGYILKYFNEYLLCQKCNSRFNIINNCIIDFMPKKPILRNNFQNEFEKFFFDFYFNNFGNNFVLEESRTAWGSPESISQLQVKRKKKLVQLLLSNTKSNIKIAADVSAGAGWFTLETTNLYNLILNMDFEWRNISYVYHKAKKKGIDNIIYLKYDMFSPPIAANSIDLIICTDTLIYGDYMVEKFLINILSFLSYQGIGLVDFYNKFHRNPLHKPYLMGYSKREIYSKFLKVNGYKFEYIPFVQEFNNVFKFLFPATRHIIKIQNDV